MNPKPVPLADSLSLFPSPSDKIWNFVNPFTPYSTSTLIQSSADHAHSRDFCFNSINFEQDQTNPDTLSENFQKHLTVLKSTPRSAEMHSTINALSLLALAGFVLTNPVPGPQVHPRGGSGPWKLGSRGSQGDAFTSEAWTTWATTETVYVTASTAAHASVTLSVAPSPASAKTTAATNTLDGQFYDKSTVFPSSAPVASSTPAPSAGVGDGSWEGVVAKWRSAMGLSALSPDSQLTSNAQKTADESVGGLKHQLNPGSMAQVLAPGDANDFEHVFVGGWLCELPNTPGLNGVCSEQSKGWAYEGQTGHAEILTSGSYQKIGCAHSDSTGVWSCDLA